MIWKRSRGVGGFEVEEVKSSKWQIKCEINWIMG